MLKFMPIAPTTSTPQVHFDPVEQKLKISGESYPENSFEFYLPIIGWVKNHLSDAAGLTLEVNVTYMNSSSTKCMLDILDLFEDAHQRGVKVNIVWRYDKENSRSFDLAEEFQEEVTLPFSIVTVSE